MNKPCYVYLLKQRYGNTYKIGISNRPEQRASELGMKVVNKVEFENRKAAFACETVLLDTYAAYRHASYRWEYFDLPSEDAELLTLAVTPSDLYGVAATFGNGHHEA